MSTHLPIKAYDKLEQWCDLNYNSTFTELSNYLNDYDDNIKFYFDSDLDNLYHLLEKNYFIGYSQEQITWFLNGSKKHQFYDFTIVKIADKNIYILEIETIK